MKKCITLLLVLLLTVPFTGCKSKAERELEEALKAADAMGQVAENAQRNYDNLMRDLDQYDRARKALENAK